MAKSIIIVSPVNTLDLYTEGVGDCVKIVVNYSFSNVVNVKIYFGNSPTRQYYQCACVVSEDLVIPINTNPTNIRVAYKRYTSANILARDVVDIMPEPPTGKLIQPVAIIRSFMYIAPAYTNTGVGGLFLISNGYMSLTNLLNATSFTLTSNLLTSYTFDNTSNVFPPSAPYDHALSITSSVINSAGASYIDFYLLYYLI